VAIEFAVGPPEAALGQEAGRGFRSQMASLHGVTLSGGREDPYYSEQLSWSGCTGLYERARAEIGEAKCPQLSLLADFSTVYLPTGALRADIDVPGWKLRVGSLPELEGELDLFAGTLGLPTQNHEVDEYWQRDVYEDDEGDEVETYCHLRLAVSEALRRGEPLWAVR